MLVALVDGSDSNGDGVFSHSSGLQVCKWFASLQVVCVACKILPIPIGVHQMGPGTIHCSRKSMDESWRSINDECLAVMVFLKMTETIPCKRVGTRIEDDRFAGFPPNLRSVLSPDVVSPALVSCARKFSETE